MTIELKPEHQRIIENAVQSGRYRTVDEFLDEAFAAWRSGANEPKFDREKARAAAERIRELRKGVTLRGLTVRELIDEGRW